MLYEKRKEVVFQGSSKYIIGGSYHHYAHSCMEGSDQVKYNEIGAALKHLRCTCKILSLLPVSNVSFLKYFNVINMYIYVTPWYTL